MTDLVRVKGRMVCKMRMLSNVLSGRLIDVLSGVLFLATALNRVTSRDDGFQIYIY